MRVLVANELKNDLRQDVRRVEKIVNDVEQQVKEDSRDNAKDLKVTIDTVEDDMKKLEDRLKQAKKETKEDDAVVLAEGKIEGIDVILVVFDFNFMGGSMGISVGNSIVKASEISVKKNIPLIIIPSSGGARMQEGILSLMQMPRTIAAIQKIKENKIPYIVVLSDPTTGGVCASFAMLGDILIAEKGATIGFAGKRVIEQTIKETIPDNFQTADYLCLLYTSPSPRDGLLSRMPSSA